MFLLIGIPMDSDPIPFFANLFLFYYKSDWIGKMKNIERHCARKFGHVYRFIDDLTAMNDNKESENFFFKEIYPQEEEL